MDSQTAFTYKALATCLAQPGETLLRERSDDDRSQRRRRLLSWLVVVLPLAFALANLVSTWHSNGMYDWGFFWGTVGIMLLLEGLFIWAFVRVLRAQAGSPITAPDSPRLTAHELCVAALTGDDDLAPPLPPQTMLTEVSPPPVTTPGTVAVTSPQGQLQRREYLLLSGCNTGMPAFLLATQLFTFFIGRRPIPWQILLLFSSLLLFFLWYLWQFVATRRNTRKFEVEVRTDGLYWRSGKRQLSLPWDNARGWVVLYLPPKNLFAGTPWSAIHAVIGQHASLTWVSYPERERSEESGDQLVQLVQGHIGLPLRNLTAGAMKIIAQPSRSLRQPRLTPTSGNGPHTLPGYVSAHPIGVVTTGLTIALLIAGILLPYAQQWYFGGQLTRLETATSQTSDPLTADLLHWTPVPSYAASSFAFTADGYVFASDTCCDVSSRIAQSINNGLIEVTVRQQSEFDLSAVGILFRANTSNHTALAFTITPSGEWHLSQFTMRADGSLADGHYLRYEGLFGGVRTIHQGQDATNRLAVLMERSTHTFFVNGQFVGGYWASGLPQSGQVGIYAEGTGGPTTFSDMLISPA